METEYTGSKYWAAVIEASQLSVPTLLFRLKWEASKRLGLHKNRYSPSTLTSEQVLGMFPLAEATPAGLLEYFRRRTNVHFYFAQGELPEIRRVWAERLPDAEKKLRAEADRICRHEFAFLGSKLNRFEGDIDWHDELDGNGRWPMAHWSEIDIRSDARIGDVKRTWELNRTQFFVTLARAYVLTRDERYARELCSQMRSWIEQNPSEMGVNWQSNLECAIRAASWLFALEMAKGWAGWEPELFTDIIRCLIDHHHHLFKDIVYSEYCMVSNHLLGDAMGVALLSLYLPELPHSAGYKEKAAGTLVRENLAQIYEEGVDYENAISYHRFVFYMYMLFGLLMERNGEEMAGPFWRRLEGMCEFAMRVRTPGGLMSQFGDWDSGRTIILDDSDVSDFASMFCTGAARFGRDDLKWAAGAFREEALWLMGPSAAGRFDAIPARPPSTTDRGYERGGFYTWRSDWTEQAEFALFKCSPFLGHTQADNLTLLYSSGGKDWLVDRGTFTYNGAWRWRTYFRHTAAHNAVCVDGLGQSLAHRAFRWLKHPRQEVHTYHSGEQFGYVAGRTSGFRHLASPVRHARSVLVARQRYVLVLDALFAGAPHDYALLWHVAPEHEVKLTGDGVAYTADATGANLWITAVGSSKVNAAVITGRTDPIQGWHSPLYGCKEPAPTVSYRTRADGPIYLATLMTTAAESMQPPALSLRFLADSERWGSDVQVEVEGPGFKERVGLPNPAGLTTGRFPQDRLWVERDGKRSHVIG